MSKIIVGMSGGVDSAVSAYLLRSLGYDVEGVTLKLYADDIALDKIHSCCSAKEAEDAKKVSDFMGIPHKTINFYDHFRENVIDRFIATYLEGGTPNPCIECNRHIKFEKLIECAGDNRIATGHYARIEKTPEGRFLLKKAKDADKDQTYVLYALTQAQLSKIVFPLGELTKPEARQIAREHGFLNAEKKDSQDICFVPDGDYAAFIEHMMGEKYPTGNFVDLGGNILGKHSGMIRYTIGQRKGLGIALGKPAFVVAKDPVKNTVTLGENKDLFSKHLTAHGINLISCDRIDSPMRVTAKVRYKQTEQLATVIQTGNDAISVSFDTPQRAISRGQSVVLYDGDIVVGGGIID